MSFSLETLLVGLYLRRFRVPRDLLRVASRRYADRTALVSARGTLTFAQLADRVWRLADGRVVINTGSFCRPLGRLVVDVAPDHLVVRRVTRRGRDYHPGDRVAEFALASAGFLTETRP